MKNGHTWDHQPGVIVLACRVRVFRSTWGVLQKETEAASHTMVCSSWLLQPGSQRTFTGDQKELGAYPVLVSTSREPPTGETQVDVPILWKQEVKPLRHLGHALVTPKSQGDSLN